MRRSRKKPLTSATLSTKKKERTRATSAAIECRNIKVKRGVERIDGETSQSAITFGRSGRTRRQRGGKGTPPVAIEWRSGLGQTPLPRPAGRLPRAGRPPPRAAARAQA